MEQTNLRKLHKREGRKVLKAHYVILMVIAVIMILFGTEFTIHATGLDATKSDSPKETTGTSYSSSALPELFENIVFSFTYTEEDAEKVGLPTDDKAGVILGIPYSRGTVANLIKGVVAGKPIIAIASGLNNIIKSRNAAIVIVIAGCVAAHILIWVMCFNLLGAAGRRCFLEARKYEKIQFSTLFYFITVKRWRRSAFTMLVKEVLLLLWSLTIVGGVIKRYSYFMVPYIVAENPDIKAMDAITLSRRMMDGHKLECFKYELSFVPWDVLGIATCGVLSMAYVVPYRLCTFSEYYAYVREYAKAGNIANADMLNDRALFEKPSREELEKAYDDIIEQEKYIEANDVRLTGFRKFMVKNFGMWLGMPSDRKRYQDVESRKFRIESDREALEGLTYPMRLSDKHGRIRNKAAYDSSINFLKAYSLETLIMMFFIFCFVGWSWEVTLHIIKDGVFVNRGALHGPWLPIYGSGGVFILMILNRFRKKPALEAVLTVLLTGSLEYFVSYYMEVAKGLQYWNYSGYFLNINGRVCFEGLFTFTVGGMFAVYVLAPKLDELINRIKPKLLVTISTILVIIFAADVVYSHFYPNQGKGITDYDKKASLEYDRAAGCYKLPDVPGVYEGAGR